MKKLFFLSVVAIVITTTVNAQVTPASLKSEMKVDKNRQLGEIVFCVAPGFSGRRSNLLFIPGTQYQDDTF